MVDDVPAIHIGQHNVLAAISIRSLLRPDAGRFWLLENANGQPHEYLWSCFDAQLCAGGLAG